MNWEKNYSKKIYDKLSNIAINKILKSKIVISESYYQKLKTNKVLLEVFIAIKSLKKFHLLICWQKIYTYNYFNITNTIKQKNS
ncbi:MAGa4850 family ICE element protein [Metamycoplasma hominis]|uniref:MAGa4850 family ICE element protein n=1 Tax=Metamycoplasma hominis TaxID=2098 RepID=UPI003BAE1E89